MNINQIIERAAILELTSNHGAAVHQACREAGVPNSEINTIASIVSAGVINRPLPSAEPVVLTANKLAKIQADAARLKKQREASRAANAARRTGEQSRVA